MRCLMLVSPSSNRVYTGAADRLAGAELRVCAGLSAVEPVSVAGISYLQFEVDQLEDSLLRVLAEQSACWALFARDGQSLELLRPVALPQVDLLDDDLITIPKYQGKTNEQFTRLLLNVTLASVERPPGRWTVLDPMCGRGTTVAVALTRGLNAAGVEADPKSVEAMAAYWRTWLRRKRLKHTADIAPVRREGKSLGKRFDVSLRHERLDQPLTFTVFTGDTRQSKALFGKRRFEAIVTDAPYGVVHASRDSERGRTRSSAALLAEAIGVWASLLLPGGALGLSWNTFGMSREDLCAALTGAGLRVREADPWLSFGHRVDSSIHRDLVVAVKPNLRGTDNGGQQLTR